VSKTAAVLEQKKKRQQNDAHGEAKAITVQAQSRRKQTKKMSEKSQESKRNTK